MPTYVTAIRQKCPEERKFVNVHKLHTVIFHHRISIQYRTDSSKNSGLYYGTTGSMNASVQCYGTRVKDFARNLTKRISLLQKDRRTVR